MSRKPITAVIALTAALGAFVAAQSQPAVKLVYAFPGGVPKDTARVQAALNTAIAAKLPNTTVELRPTDWGAYDQKMNLTYASGQDCDLAFSASWINNYGLNAANGNLRALDDLLPKSAPQLFKRYSADVWRAVKVGGKVYGIPNFDPSPKLWGVVVDAAMARKYNLNLATVRSFADLTPFLQRVRAGEPNRTAMYADPNNTLTTAMEYLGFDPVIDNLFVGVKYNDKGLKVVSVTSTPEFRRGIELARAWNQAGITPRSLPNADEAEAGRRAGKYVAIVDQWTGAPKVEEYKNQWTMDVVGKSLTPSFITTAASTAALTSVCATSKNPERALALLELLHTDPAIYRTLVLGVQDTHWVWKDQAKRMVAYPSGVSADNAPYNVAGWLLSPGPQGAYYRSASDPANEEILSRINRSAQASVALGFAFNADPVKTEIAQLSAVMKELAQPLRFGQVDAATGLATLQQRLQAAGMDRVVAEVQRQLTAWSKTQ
jgi:putative aldouronate transport system substrate-binding protein